jgi:transcriptional regulator with XRE-family HTH domain
MNGHDLRSRLEELGISQAELSRLIEVTPRAVSLWLSEEREVAGPVAAYLRLLTSLPRSLQAKEFARIRKQDPTLYEGMYRFDYQGKEGAGLGVVVLARGQAFGSDGGVHYDGTYEPSAARFGYVDAHLHLTVPPGVPLVQGVPAHSVAYGFDLDCSFAARGATAVRVETPFGWVDVQVTFLRPVPA